MKLCNINFTGFRKYAWRPFDKVDSLQYKLCGVWKNSRQKRQIEIFRPIFDFVQDLSRLNKVLIHFRSKINRKRSIAEKKPRIKANLTSMVCIWRPERPPRRRNPRTSNRKFRFRFRLEKRRKFAPDKIARRPAAARPQIRQLSANLEENPEYKIILYRNPKKLQLKSSKIYIANKIDRIAGKDSIFDFSNSRNDFNRIISCRYRNPEATYSQNPTKFILQTIP